jgi:hypothetical protein
MKFESPEVDKLRKLWSQSGDGISMKATFQTPQ